MSIWAVIPAKTFEEGKSRLSGVLTADERHALNKWFFTRTLNVALQVFSPDAVLVVSRSLEAREMAKQCCARTMADPASGDLNEVLTAASEVACKAGATGVLSLSCDLPSIEAEDLKAMLPHPNSWSITIACDQAGIGTNALFIRPIGLIPYSYGLLSCAAHMRSANAAGFDPLIIKRAGLALDIDTADSFERWRSEGPSAWPRPN